MKRVDMYDPASVDALLDHQQMRAHQVSDILKVRDDDLQTQEDVIELLRDSLSVCLAELPDDAEWQFHQQVYMITDPECLSEFHELFANLSRDTGEDDTLVV